LMLHKADHQASLETKEGNYENWTFPCSPLFDGVPYSYLASVQIWKALSQLNSKAWYVLHNKVCFV
jgi:hypothetical protein